MKVLVIFITATLMFALAISTPDGLLTFAGIGGLGLAGYIIVERLENR